MFQTLSKSCTCNKQSIPFYRTETDSERLKNLPKVTQVQLGFKDRQFGSRNVFNFYNVIKNIKKNMRKAFEFKELVPSAVFE